ncbi:treslin-like [Ixodes scapularis]|uniref:treslin-like n=1 Tax=Ixodes scapularis TaxID=6945 RepID=UPI001A9F632C|nr:treslin-like [Ixodes scapularis]
MSESTQVVFAIDVASFYTYEDEPAVGDYQQAVNAVRYGCLKLLTHFGRERTRWGYKFYSSSGLTRQRMDRRPFREFNLDHFEEFEEELAQRLERYRSACQAMGRAGQRAVGDRDPPCAILRTALTQVASEFPWDAPSMASPVKRRKRKRGGTGDRENACSGGNYIFNLSRCPRSQDEVAFFLGKKDASQLDGSDVAEVMVPAQVRRLLVDSLAAKLLWIDTGLEPQDGAHALIQSALRCLGGDAVPLEALVRAGADCAPFSAIADLCLKGGSRGQQHPPLFAAAAVTLGQERVGSALFCPDDPLPEPRARWKEVRILARTRACAGARALSSRRVQVFRCPDGSAAAGADDSARLRGILNCLQRQREVLFVELVSDLPAKQYAFLSPLFGSAFCLQVVTEPLAFGEQHTERRSPRAPADGDDSDRCPLPSTDPFEWCPQRTMTGDGSSRWPPFRAAALERWYVAPSSVNPFPGSDQHDTDEQCGEMLKRLRRSYRLGSVGGTKDDAAIPQSERLSQQTPRPAARKSLGASLKPGGRSADILAHSYADARRASGRREKPACAQGSRSSPRAPRGTSYADREQLLAHLKESYSGALDSGFSTSLLTCAQNIVSVIKRFVESQPRSNGKQSSVCELLRTHFVLGCPQIAEKYGGSGDDASQRRRLREYQLQALLALEEEVSFGPTGACVERVTSLLRTLSFVHSPSVASEFLRGIVRDTYLATLRDVLVEVGDELSVPLFSDDGGSLLGSEGDFGRLDGPTSAASQDSFLSSIPSSFNSQTLRDAADNRSLARVDLSQPSSSTSLSKRQIVVPKVPKCRRLDTKPVRTSPKKSEPGRVRRDLFTATTGSPQLGQRRVLKTTFVPETPTSRQGRRLVQRRQELLRRRSRIVVTVPVVEETPEKRVPKATEDVFSFPSPSKLVGRTPERAAATPKRVPPSRAPFSQETPPRWNGSESLFSSPEGHLSISSCERTPAKAVLFSGVVVLGESPQGAPGRRGSVTPRRRVSKRLLGSPSVTHSPLEKPREDSPASKKPCLKLPGAEPEAPRRLFEQLVDSSPRKEPDTEECLRQNLPNGTIRGSRSGDTETNGDSSRGVVTSPVLTKLTTRFTRSKSKETGLSPQQLFLLSQASPVKGERQTEQRPHGATPSQEPGTTPSCRKRRRIVYTPPSALSLLHLTSSPMLLKK